TRVLKLQQAAFSPNSPELLPTLDALALLSLQEKQYADSEAQFRQTLAIREGNLGPMHMDVAKNLDQLGSLYKQQKKYAEALSCYERSLFIWVKELGAENPELAGKYQGLAEIYAALNRPVDAEPLVKQVLTARESETVASLNTLASIYIARDNYTEAE